MRTPAATAPTIMTPAPWLDSLAPTIAATTAVDTIERSSSPATIVMEAPSANRPRSATCSRTANSAD